jgi:hypothetical protein
MGMGADMGQKPTRGIRNNNPLNIRVSKDTWVGEVPASQKKDRSFEEFLLPVYGLRAAFKLLLKYHRDYGLRTVNAIIGRWAPPNENNTREYVAAVCKGSGFKPDQHLTENDLEKLAGPMTRVENAGQQPYSDDLIHKAFLMALGIA